MVFQKIKDLFSGNDEKYEVLYYKYSQIKVENQKLIEDHRKNLLEYKDDTSRKVALSLVQLYEDIETAKMDSFKVKALDPDLQRLLIDINKIESTIKDTMVKFSVEEMTITDRFFDPEHHEIASYQDAKGMAKGIIMKTVKKGFKYKGEVIKKPRVVVTK